MKDITENERKKIVNMLNEQPTSLRATPEG